MAQYSLAFSVAAALVRGRVGVEEVTGAALTDPAIERLVRATTVTEDARHQARFPDGRWAELALVLAVAAEGRYDDGAIAALTREAADRLRSTSQFFDPFKFVVYTELIGVEHRPVR